MGRHIFISYRRDDSAGHAGRVHDRLTAEFGRDRVFMDVDSIPLGSDFVEALRQQVANCAILLALIGPDWIDARDSKGLRRLDDPWDLVRLEIRSALERRIPVIPIAVGGFSFPLSEQDLPEDVRVLRYRQGLEVRNNSFSSDMALLVGRLRGLMERPVRSPRRTSGPTAPSYGGRGRKVAKVAKFSLMIFWHASGLRERDACRMQSNLAKRVAADVAKHYNKNAPDAFFVRYRADVRTVRYVLQALPDPPQYIFAHDYPSAECGWPSKYDMSVGLHSIHRYDDELSETPYLLDAGDLDYLVEAGIDQAEFVHRLHELAPSRTRRAGA
jgi:hypothetical protein